MSLKLAAFGPDPFDTKSDGRLATESAKAPKQTERVITAISCFMIVFSIFSSYGSPSFPSKV